MTAQAYDWSKLNHLQLGRYGEYFVKMEFTRAGFQVYSSEVDDRGIDFVTRRDRGPYLEIQVKSLCRSEYAFMPKALCPLAADRLLALVLFLEGKPPILYLVPTLDWSTPNALLVSRDYPGKKSKAEWGIQISAKNRKLLDRYTFTDVLSRY